MAYMFYVSIKGAKQGAFQGPVTVKGHEQSIGGLYYSHSITSPRDLASGQSSGKRSHTPFVITKSWDRTSPMFLNALTTNEVLSSCVCTFFRPAGSNAVLSSPTARLTLTNATVLSINQFTASPDQLNQFESHELEEISLVYHKIEWTWVDGGITAADDWVVSR